MKGGQMVTVLVDGEQVFGAASGEVYAFDVATGGLLWHNSLPGFGMNIASLATVGSNSGVLLQQRALQQQQSSSGA
jgi:outer membrane protein assembly factor BamB